MYHFYIYSETRKADTKYLLLISLYDRIKKREFSINNNNNK